MRLLSHLGFLHSHVASVFGEAANHFRNVCPGFILATSVRRVHERAGAVSLVHRADNRHNFRGGRRAQGGRGVDCRCAERVAKAEMNHCEICVRISVSRALRLKDHVKSSDLTVIASLPPQHRIGSDAWAVVAADSAALVHIGRSDRIRVENRHLHPHPPVRAAVKRFHCVGNAIVEVDFSPTFLVRLARHQRRAQCHGSKWLLTRARQKVAELQLQGGHPPY